MTHSDDNGLNFTGANDGSACYAICAASAYGLPTVLPMSTEELGKEHAEGPDSLLGVLWAEISTRVRKIRHKRGPDAAAVAGPPTKGRTSADSDRSLLSDDSGSRKL